MLYVPRGGPLIETHLPVVTTSTTWRYSSSSCRCSAHKGSPRDETATSVRGPRTISTCTGRFRGGYRAELGHFQGVTTAISESLQGGFKVQVLHPKLGKLHHRPPPSPPQTDCQAGAQASPSLTTPLPALPRLTIRQGPLCKCCIASP